jgi:F0F1-type ATP synthase assembly protein I
MALGAEFVGFIAAGILIGRWIDGKLGTEPVALLVGMLTAIVAASLHIYKMANRMMASDDET